jgi:ADP-dependent phosphofructokinase/glucokinase
LITNSKTGPRQSPFHRVLIAYNPATPAFQASLVGKSDVLFPEFETVRRAREHAGAAFTCDADIFFNPYVLFFVDVEFIDS